MFPMAPDVPRSRVITAELEKSAIIRCGPSYPSLVEPGHHRLIERRLSTLRQRRGSTSPAMAAKHALRLDFVARHPITRPCSRRSNGPVERAASYALLNEHSRHRTYCTHSRCLFGPSGLQETAASCRLSRYSRSSAHKVVHNTLRGKGHRSAVKNVDLLSGLMEPWLGKGP
jgi:hypothetical protein